MKPSVPKGTRDFLPEEVVKRKYMFGVIEEVFVKFGYLPIETPSMENLQTLAGKYGEEGEKLLFKVLNNGDYLQKADREALESLDSNKLLPSISKRGMRYDLTVPFARFVVQHRNEIQLPFKRYQIQPVWRADRPQKGRYQEFYQCDVDVVGSTSLIYEAELVQIYDEAFARLNLPVRIRINHRKMLTGIAEVCGIDNAQAMTVAIDKWDKIGPDGVIEDMMRRGITEDSARAVIQVLGAGGLDELEEALGASDTGISGLADLRRVQSLLKNTSLTNTLKIDPKLARGLDYYTGCIFEVEGIGYDGGSIGGGGRYDDLTGIFGMPDVPGVGVSFGAARIYDALEQLNLFPDAIGAAPRVLFLSLDDESLEHAFSLVTDVRQAGIAADIYPEAVKLKKQMKYADGLDVPFVVIIGESERNERVYSLKNMVTGDQQSVGLQEMIAALS